MSRICMRCRLRCQSACVKIVSVLSHGLWSHWHRFNPDFAGAVMLSLVQDRARALIWALDRRKKWNLTKIWRKTMKFCLTVP